MVRKKNSDEELEFATVQVPSVLSRVVPVSYTHLDVYKRQVLKPLSELAPNFRHPITHKTVAQMLAELPVDITEGSEA